MSDNGQAHTNPGGVHRRQRRRRATPAEADPGVDEVDANVKIVDAAIADRTRLGRVKVHQTTDRGAKGVARGGALGVIVGAIVLGPAGAVVGGAAGGVLNGLRNRFHDIGIDDKFMRQVTKEVDKGKSALFILYEGNWASSIGMIEQAITAEKALLIHSTLPAEDGGRAQGARRAGGRGSSAATRSSRTTR